MPVEYTGMALFVLAVVAVATIGIVQGAPRVAVLLSQKLQQMINIMQW
jgi:hypothetical protein